MLKNIFSAQTLKLQGLKSLPIWRSIFALFAISMAWLLIAEIIARTSLGYYLPPPSVGADSFEFDTKVYYLEQSIRQRGALDCLIVGDSMTNDGPDPKLIEVAYQAETGSPLHCFNFGMPALMLDASGPLTTALANRFHPKLLILILSGRDFDSSFGAPFRHVAFSDWANQNLGQTSLRGWAVNSLYGYRYALFFQYWLTPSNRIKFTNTWSSITPQGFTPLNGQREADAVTGSGPVFERTDTAAQHGFDQLLELKSTGTNMLVIDAPVRPDLYSQFDSNFFQPYRQYMQTTLDEYGIPFWLTEEISINIPPEGWYDLQHINEKGVPIFSTWLGQQLAQNYPPEFFK